MCFRSHTIPSISLKACAVLLCALEINPFVQWLHIYINPATQCYIHLAAHSVIRLSRYHIHIALVTVYCYNCSILLIVFNVLLCLIYKLNFVIRCMYRKKTEDI